MLRSMGRGVQVRLTRCLFMDKGFQESLITKVEVGWCNLVLNGNCLDTQVNILEMDAKWGV